MYNDAKTTTNFTPSFLFRDEILLPRTEKKEKNDFDLRDSGVGFLHLAKSYSQYKWILQPLRSGI